jgi:hypothetical protein
MGLEAVLDQGLLDARPMVMGGVIPDQIDPLPPQALAPRGQEADGRLLTQPVAQPRDDSPTGSHARHTWHNRLAALPGEVDSIAAGWPRRNHPKRGSASCQICPWSI